MPSMTHQSRNRSWFLKPTGWFLLVAFFTGAWVSWSAFEYPMAAFSNGSDYWEHSAAINEWKKDLLHPGNPHLALEVGTPRYMPYFFVLAATAKWFNLDPIQAMAVGATLNMALFSLGVFLFFRLYFKNDWAPLVGFAVLLCGWGVGWLWSNVYQLRDLFFVAAYPSMHVFGLCFVSWWQAARLINGQAEGVVQYTILASLVALMLTSHPLTGVFGLGTLSLMIVFEPGADWSTRGKLALTLVVGAFSKELWPFFSVWDVATGTSGDQADTWVQRGELSEKVRDSIVAHDFYDPIQVLVVLGPSLLGVPALLILLARRLHLFIVAGFFGTMGIYLLNLVFPVPLGHRFLLFAIVFLQLAFVWWLLQTSRAWRASFVTRTKPITANRPVVLSGVLLLLMVGWNIALGLSQYAGYQLFPDGEAPKRYSYLAPVPQDMRVLTTKISDDAIVIGDRTIVWPLSTFRGKRLAYTM